MNLKNGIVFTSKFVGTGSSSYEKRIYRAAVSQKLRNTGLVLLRMGEIIAQNTLSWLKLLIKLLFLHLVGRLYYFIWCLISPVSGDLYVNRNMSQ